MRRRGSARSPAGRISIGELTTRHVRIYRLGERSFTVNPDKAGWNARQYVSIKEVAAKAGVSFQTASKVLNGGNVRVSSETAARILAVAERLGYRPNTVARSLVQRSTATIGLIAGTSPTSRCPSSPWPPSAQRAATRTRCWSGTWPRAGGRRLRRADADRAAGGRDHRRSAAARGGPEVADLLRRYVPAVSLHHVPGGGVPLVGSNHRAAARVATEHLIRLGHTAIGTVTGRSAASVAQPAARVRGRAAGGRDRARRGSRGRVGLDAGRRGGRDPAAAAARRRGSPRSSCTATRWRSAC